MKLLKILLSMTVGVCAVSYDASAALSPEMQEIGTEVGLYQPGATFESVMQNVIDECKNRQEDDDLRIQQGRRQEVIADRTGKDVYTLNNALVRFLVFGSLDPWILG